MTRHRRPSVTDVRFTAAPEYIQGSGLLGWAKFTVGDFAIDGVTVRRLTSGVLSLSYPERPGANGKRWPIVRPKSSQARRDIERQVLSAILPSRGSCSEAAR